MVGQRGLIPKTVILVALLWVTLPGLSAAAAHLEPWKINYLNGIGAEAKHQYGRALQFFDEAQKLQSKPIKNEWFAQYGRHDYDPQYHIARCLLKLGGNPELIEAWINASRRGGVTSSEALDDLLDDLHRRQGTPVPTRTPAPSASPNPMTPTAISRKPETPSAA